MTDHRPGDYPIWPNLAVQMFARAREWPDRVLFQHHNGQAWVETRWDRFARQAASVARGLRACGVRAGDRVVIVSENRPEVAVAFTALMALKALPVPAYTTNTVADHAHILRDTGARVAIASSAAHARRLSEAAGPDGLDHLVGLDPGVGTLAHAALLSSEEDDFEDVFTEARRIEPSDLALLLYTSGTGGQPRGVMLPHRSILANCRDAFETLRPVTLRDEVHLSLLPLTHAFELTVGLFFLSSIGTTIAFCRGPEHLAADMVTVRPTIMVVVPRVLEVLRSRIVAGLARQPRWRQILARRFMALNRQAADTRLPLAARLQRRVLHGLVGRAIQARFGGRFRAAVCGGARLDPDTGRFFQALGLVLMQGYGQTECGPVISVTPPERVRIETVGRVFASLALRIADDGEILVRGDAVMTGYWRNEAATATALRDGWLHTGDVGGLDPDGNLVVTDRKRDILVLSGGENVSPARVEAMLTAESAIAQAVVTGDGQSGLAAILVAAESATPAQVAEAVGRANRHLAVFERVRRHVLVPAFTVENGLLTPTLKVRRRQVIANHPAVPADSAK